MQEVGFTEQSEGATLTETIRAAADTHPAAAFGSRWFGVGRGTHSDALAAAVAATKAALAGRQPALVVLFCSIHENMAETLSAVQGMIGSAPLIGCTGVAQYASGGGDCEATVVISALGGDGFEVAVTAARDVSAGHREAGVQAALPAEGLTRDHRLLLMLCDGLTGEQHEVVRGAYDVLGATMPLVGGCAADNRSYNRTFQFISDERGVEVLSDAVVAAAIGSDAPMGIGIAHGLQKYGDPMLVTDSSGGRVTTLDGEPALDVFLRRVAVDHPGVADPKGFTFPLGMSRRDTEDIRVIHRGDPHDRSITSLADVPQGALLWAMRSDPVDLVRSIGTAHDQALASLAGRPAIGLMAFDCGVRFLMLGEDGRRDELAELGRCAGEVPFAGFYTYGEIARSHGSRGMHHLTVVVLAFA